MSYVHYYLVKGCKSVNIGRVDVGPLVEHFEHLVLIAGRARCQKDAAGGEFYASGVVFGDGGLPVRLGFLPSFQLLGPFEQGRTRTGLERHLNDTKNT